MLSDLQLGQRTAVSCPNSCRTWPVAVPATGSGAQRTLATEGLAPGLYLLRVQRPGASQTIRFAKQ